MNNFPRTYRLGLGGGLTKAIKYLLIINTAVFILQHIFPDNLLIKWFGMHPKWVYSKFQIWQVFTYMFLHAQGEIWHLLFNMFVLWMFGCEVERTLGTREFVKYYLLCGVGAGIFHLIWNFHSTIPVVGASGAIYGVMVAFAVLFPERLITLLLFLILPVQIRAKVLVMIFAGISLFLGVFGGPDGVAHFAHLGGMLVGFVYLKLDWRLDYLGTWIRRQRESRKMIKTIKKRQAIERIRERVDQILDKINEVGYDNLTEEEKRILKEASHLLSKEQEKEN
ncbi:MAG: rhomboid family intramembrane serine protease [Calditrichaeota bacterium]|nr:MAG: rhomboid family intramembrane serine protease [Calditrichota bacterium]